MTIRLRTWLVGAAVAALLTAANASHGGYFSQSWGWIALAFVAAVSLALILGLSARPGALRIAFAALMTAFGAWVALSVTWSLSTAGSIREVERMLVYIALAGAVALVARRGDGTGIAAGACVGAVAVAGYGLATRLFPDRLESYDSPTLEYRLAEPIGYWNALGLLAALGFLLALGFAAQARGVRSVAAAGACLPVLAATLYFTFSRGAWAALAVGLLALVALDARRLRLLWTALAVAPASVAGVAFASQQESLTTEGAAQADAVAEGERLAVVLIVLLVASGALAVAARWVSLRVPAPRGTRRIADVALAGLGVVAVVAAVALAGGPADAYAKIESRFDATFASDTVDLNDRLFSASGNGRAESIGIAWDAGRERPLVGHGAGSYVYLYYESRETDQVIRDAHSLYAETFAELGLVGVVLLVSALLVPLVAAVRARRSRFVPAAAAAYAAWLAHAGIDWHWEMVGLTATALLAGSVALLAAERGPVRLLPDLARWPLLAGSVALTAVALVSLVGNQALFAGREDLARGDLAGAVENADHAESLLPWAFEPHYVRGDAARRVGDRAAAARAYRRAIDLDERNWVSWLRLAQVARGAERRAAFARVHELNPYTTDFPGEGEGESP